MESKQSTKANAAVAKSAGYIYFLLAVLFSALLMSAIAAVIYFFVKSPVDYAFIKTNFYVNAADFKPERAEKLAYYLLTFMFPFLYTAVLSLVKKINLPRIPLKILFALEGCFITAAIIFAFSSMWFIDEGIRVYSRLGSWAVAVFFIFLYGLCFYCHELKPKTRGAVLLVLSSAAAFVFVYVLLLYRPPFFTGNFTSVWHFMPYFAPVYKTLSGLAPAVDFNNLYGFYPYFYAAAAKVFGGITLNGFMLANTVLISISLFFAAAAIWLNTKNRALSLVAITAYAALFYIFNIAGSEVYLQFLPHRVFFITFIMLLCSLYLRPCGQRLKKFYTAVGYIAGTLALAWNIESGMIVLWAWTLMLIALRVSRMVSGPKEFWFTAAKNIIFAFLAMFAAFCFVQAASYLQSGAFADFADIMRMPKLFYETGFFMLPMEFGHGWLLPIIVYAVALVKSFNLLPFIKGKDEYFTPQRAALYFVFAFIGLGIFIYYQGRSHHMTLQAVVFPAVCLLAFFAQEYLDKFRSAAQNDVFRKILAYRICIIAAFFIFYCGIGVALLCGPMPARVRQEMRSSVEALIIKQAVDFIKEHAGARKKDIIALQSSVLYAELGEADTLPFPTSVDWILKSDLKKVYNYLESSENMLVLDKNTALQLHYLQEDGEFTKILSRYKRLAGNGEFFIFEISGQ